MAFNSVRLKKARLYRNMTITQLADKINISKQAISQFEKGQPNSPRPKNDVFYSIVLALGFPKQFFEEQDKYNVQIENTFFRALSTTKNLDKKTQEIKTEFVVRIYNFLNEYLSLPKLNLPNISAIDNMDYDLMASTVRNYWSLGELPVLNMVNLFENKGIIVSSFFVKNIKIDAFTQIHSLNGNDQFCVVLGNNKLSAVRRNFDCAHELGHILLHSSYGDISLLDNEEQRELETQANQFAGAFLLPKDSFFKDLTNPTDLDSYVKLKEKWRVSISAMIVRARQLERISNSEYQSLMKKVSYRKWRMSEPYDNLWELQKPMLFKKSIDILKDKNIMNYRQFIDNLSRYGLSMYPQDIEELLSLDEGYLSDKAINIDNIEPTITLR